MPVRVTTLCPMIAAWMALFCCFGVAQETGPMGTNPVNSIVDALEKTQAGVRPQASYQVIREYRLFGANDSRANSDVVAELNFRPSLGKVYRIQKSSGSTRGQQVVRSVLDREVEATSKGNQSRTALNRDNYDFTYIGETILDGQPCYQLELKPRRREKELISGKAWVDKHLFFVRQIEGEVAKTPSWWLRSVRVRLVFADLQGTWLQTSMEAVADVRLVGRHTLTSRVLSYRAADEVASTVRYSEHKP
jgi:hypothetical protein